MNEFDKATRPMIEDGDYRVAVKRAQRDDTLNYVVRLLFVVVGGDYAGTTVPLTFKEKHDGQRSGGQRHHYRTMWALGFKPNEAGVFEYAVEELVGRECRATLEIRRDHQGTPRVSIVFESLRPLGEVE